MKLSAGKFKYIIYTLLLFLFIVPENLIAQKQLKIEWFGQACFRLISPGGLNIVMDPMKMGGYQPEDLKADVVTISHEHFDHNNLSIISGKPEILRGLSDGGKDYSKINKEIKDVSISTIQSYHDGQQGEKRGKNAIFIFEINGKKIAHCGDLGHMVAEKELMDIDILIIPVGGYYTLEPEDVTKMAERIKPGYLIPMHFKTEALTSLPISTEEKFLKGKDNVKKVNSYSVEIDLEKLPEKTEILVLDYKH